MKHLHLALFMFLSCLAPSAPAEERRIAAAEYRDRVYGAWIGQIAGALYGFPFEGRIKNVYDLDHYLKDYQFAIVDDDYYYEMVALYGFERYGLEMTVEQLGEMWKEYRAGTWGSSEQTRLALERGIKAPDTGSPRYNRWFHTIGPQFSSDIYGMISPGMVNLAGAVARKYSHINGYAEGSDGAVFVAACVSEAFFEKNPVKIVRQAAQLIDPRSNYRKAVDQVLQDYEKGRRWQDIAEESEARWRPDYPQVNNSVANGALVALGLLFGEGDYMKSIQIVTQAGDYTDADCNAANISSVLGAMHGYAAIPEKLKAPLHDRIYGDGMGPVKFGRIIDEKISGLATRIAALGEKNLLANGARRDSGVLVIPRQTVRTQPLEYFDINDYASLWNPDWKLAGAGRGGGGVTFLSGDVLVTYPRDSRPCRLERKTSLAAGHPKLVLNVGAAAGRPWRLQVVVNDDSVLDQTVTAPEGAPVYRPTGGASPKDPEPQWTPLSIDLSKYAGQNVMIRLYQWLPASQIAGSGYWKTARLE